MPQQIPEHIRKRIEGRRQAKGRTPAPAAPALAAPPTEQPSTTGAIKDWVFSKEGGGATAARIGGDLAGGLAGAKLGATVGSAFGPVGTVVGGLGGLVIGGAIGGAAGSVAGQKLEGREEIDPKDVALNAALGAVPGAFGTAATPAKWAARSAVHGAGLGAAYDAGHQLYVEGKSLGEYDPKQTAGAAAVGGGMGYGFGKLFPQVKPGAGGPTVPKGLEDVKPPIQPKSKDLTPAAARAATSRGKTANRRAAIKNFIAANPAKETAVPQLAGPKAKRAPVAVGDQDVAALKEGQKLLKQGLNQLRKDAQAAMGRDDQGGTKANAVNAMMKRVKRVMANKIEPGDPDYDQVNRELAALGLGGNRLGEISDTAPRLTPEAQAVAEAKIAKPKKPRVKKTPEEKQKAKLLKKLEYTNTPAGERAARAKEKKLLELYPDSGAKASRIVEELPNGKIKVHGWRITSKATRKAAVKAKIEASKQAKKSAQASAADPIRKLSLAASGPGAKIEQNPLKPGFMKGALQQKIPGTLTEVKPKLGPKPKMRLTGNIPDDVATMRKAGIGPDQFDPGVEDDVARYWDRYGRQMKEEGQMLPDPDDIDILPQKFDEVIPDDVERYLQEDLGIGGKAVTDEFATARPKGTTPDDWDTHKIGTQVLSTDFARQAQAKGYKVWLTPGKAKKGGEIMGGKLGEPAKGTGRTKYSPAQGWEVHVEKGADVKDLLTEVGMAPKQPQLEPGVYTPGDRPRQPGAMGGPARGVKLKGEEVVAGPKAKATIGDAVAEPTPGMLAQAAKQTDEVLERASQSHKNLAVREAAKQELARRNPAGEVRSAYVPEKPINRDVLKQTLIPPSIVPSKKPVPDIEVIKPRGFRLQETGEPLADATKKKWQSIGELQKELDGATPQRKGAIRAAIKQLIDEETGSMPIFGPKEGVPGLDDPRLTKIAQDQLADLALQINPPPPSGSRATRGLQRWWDRDWTLRKSVEEGIEMGKVWDSSTNPLEQARMIKGGKPQARIEMDWTDMVDAHKEIHRAGLDEPFVQYLNLSINARSEATVIQHLKNAKPRAEQANLAYMEGLGKQLSKSKMRPLLSAKRYADKALKKAEANWDRMEKGRALQGGFKPGESDAAIAALKAKVGDENWAKIQEGGDTFARLHDEALTEAVESGMVSPALAKQYRERGPYHGPQMRLKEQVGTRARKQLEHHIKQGLIGVKSKEAEILFKFTGAQQTSKHPVFGSMMHIANVHRQTWENKLVKNFVDEFGSIPQYAPFIKKLTKKAERNLDPALASVPVWRDGKEEIWSLPRHLAEIAVNPTRLELETMGLGPLKFFKQTKNILTRSATTWSPPFLIGRNPPRDIGSSRVNLPEIYTLGDPADYAKHTAEYAKAWGQLLKDKYGKHHPDIKAFHRSGAGMSTLQRSMSPTQFIGRRQLQELEHIPSGSLAKAGNGMMNVTGDFASALEMASKLVSWRRLKAAGYSDDAAAYMTRTYGGSPDFAIGGELKPFADLMLMFYNPSVRGFEQTFMALKRQTKLPAFMGKELQEKLKVGRTDAYQDATQNLIALATKKLGSKFVTRILGSAAAAAGALAMYNSQFRDENGETYISRIPSYVRNNNWVVFNPLGVMADTEFGHMPYYFTWAKPHSQVLIQSPIERSIYYASGERSEFTNLGDVPLDMLEGASPVQVDFGGGDSLVGDVTRGIASTLNPAAGAPLDLMANQRSSTGGPIVSRSRQEAFPEDRASPRGSDLIKDWVGGFNETFRDETGRELGISPAYVEYFIQRSAPGLHGMARSAEELKQGLTGEQTPERMDFDPLQTFTRTTPIVGSIIKTLLGPGSQPDARLTALKNEFYTAADKASMRFASAKLKLQEHGREAARQYYDKAPRMESYEVKKAFDSAIMDLAKVHKDRGDLLIKLDQTEDEGERTKLQEKAKQLNNRELAGLRRWKRQMNKLQGKPLNEGLPRPPEQIPQVFR